MIERRLLESYPIVAEGFEEGRQRRTIIRTQVQPPDTGARPASREIPRRNVGVIGRAVVTFPVVGAAFAIDNLTLSLYNSLYLNLLWGA